MTIQPEGVEVRVEDRIATITLARSRYMNAINDGVLLGLRSALTRCADDDSVRVVLLTGQGKAFSAGQDLSARDPRRVAFPLDLQKIQEELYHPVARLLATLEKPVICALNGVAAGAGASLALGCDIVLAARSARIVLSFVKVGLSADAGLGWHLVRALGPAKARALLLSGATISAEQAEAAGLIFRCVDDEDLMSEAKRLADRFTNGPQAAIQSIRRCVEAATSARNFDEYLAIESALQGRAGMSPDYREGVLAFLEKRQPEFG